MANERGSDAKTIDVKTFWQAVGQRATGATIVTAHGSGGPAGLLALSATHVAADPPTMLVSIDNKTSALASVLEAGHFAINYLPQGDPPPGLKERVLERVQQLRFELLPAAQRSWYATGVAGVEVTALWSNEASGRHTILLRLEAGAELPMHRHPGPEECFVVSGDLRDGDLELGPGDYVRHDGGTEHTISTRNGCLLYVTTSSPDEQTQSTSS